MSKRCQCGEHELTKMPRSRRGVKWRRFVAYIGLGYCVQHDTDVCVRIWRGTNHFPGVKGKARVGGFDKEGLYLTGLPPMEIERLT